MLLGVLLSHMILGLSHMILGLSKLTTLPAMVTLPLLLTHAHYVLLLYANSIVVKVMFAAILGVSRDMAGQCWSPLNCNAPCKACLTTACIVLVSAADAAVCRGVPVDRYTRLETVAAYWIFGLFWGKAVSQNKKGHLIGHIKVSNPC